MGMTREGVRISLLKQGVKPTRTRSVWVREKMEARAEGAERLVEEIVREKGGLLREMVLRGSSFNDVREYLGVSRKVVCRVYDELKLSAEVVERRGERDEEIKRLYEKGFCIVEVAGEVGVSHVTVMRVLKRMGVETRKGRRRRRGVDTFIVDGEG
jgi:transposase-like protein